MLSSARVARRTRGVPRREHPLAPMCCSACVDLRSHPRCHPLRRSPWTITDKGGSFKPSQMDANKVDHEEQSAIIFVLGGSRSECRDSMGGTPELDNQCLLLNSTPTYDILPAVVMNQNVPHWKEGDLVLHLWAWQVRAPPVYLRPLDREGSGCDLESAVREDTTAHPLASPPRPFHLPLHLPLHHRYTYRCTHFASPVRLVDRGADGALAPSQVWHRRIQRDDTRRQN